MEAAKILIILGLVISFIGFVMLYGPHIPFLGRLPGDIIIKRENFSFYFPLTTSIILSILVTIILRVLNR